MTAVASNPRLALILGLRFGVKGVGDASMRALLPAIGESPDPEQVLDALQTRSGLNAARRAALQAALTSPVYEQVNEIGQRLAVEAERHGVAVVIFDDPRYPPLLKLTSDAPALLFARGTLPVTARAVACVGTRNPSTFGTVTAHKMTAALAEADWVIVSGLALGIDSIAHRTALDAGIPTVAILGNGLDTVYPAANAALAEQIVAAGGALVSEQPFGEKATPANLVRRDRLQSGMSIATCVFESGTGGGAMHAAHAAQKQGRLVVCPVPTGPYRDLESCRGLLQLIGEGVYAVASRDAYASLLTELERRLAPHAAQIVLDGRD